ncbi:hypothetical protein OIU77_026863 [Salix suchowensis]|uniref:Uncharacterized protein n=1 Tax=Salix suchowensis TaxID=1278906 RepID=A0ABQ9BQ96_9ROSI|nr:hypothetical protein OIU77_026863 [Salix suchowensis]
MFLKIKMFLTLQFPAFIDVVNITRGRFFNTMGAVLIYLHT